MQKINLTILFFIILSNYILIQAWDGSGTQANPYQIKTKADLEALADSVNNGNNWSRNKHFKLMNDITDSVRNGIGSNISSSGVRTFKGTFDGQGYTIILAINGSTGNTGAGLFNSVGAGVTIKNVVTLGYVNGGHTGGIVGRTFGNTTINDKIINCINGAKITGSYSSGAVGGIVGHGQRLTIENCINIGVVISTGSNGGFAGGVVGCLEYTYIINCINSAFIKGADVAAGIGGGHGPTSHTTSIISNSVNTGVVIGPNASGIVCNRYSNNIQVTNCFYGKQMCIYGGFGGKDIVEQAEGRLTKELIGMNLQAILGNEDWTYSTNLYPMLKELKDEIASKVAASPAYLDDVNSDYDVHNNVRKCFYVNTENDVQWTKAFDKIEFSDGGKIYLENLGEDTMYASIGDYKKTIPINVNNLCQKSLTDDINFTIRASEHELVAPNRRNYRVPIYITASKDISGYIIEKLVLEIDRNIFYPRSIINNNGIMKRNFIDTMIEIIIENIKVPDLKSGIESTLLTIRGDVILGNKDSNSIDLKEVVFAEELTEYPELIDGYITLNICREVYDRFLGHIGHSTSLAINNNPATEFLEAKCKVIESGTYTLEIVDILGKSAIVKEWKVNINDEQEFNFTIPILMYGNGSYFLVLSTPSAKYSEKFIVEK
ncbi:MAG: T9SS type A sorting domain-containing protein [Bacteroidetes bacterium]|nr:T9SS type A sorting domain-containing protein [Bacteroidota bacterium]